MFEIIFADGTKLNYDGCFTHRFTFKDMEEDILKKKFSEENLKTIQLSFQGNVFKEINDMKLDRIEFLSKEITEWAWDRYVVYIESTIE